jgi:cytochrome b6-f complex iron-sulfur subunit
MDNMPSDLDDDKLIITPLPYEVLHEGRDEATEIARQRLARRRFLRRSTLTVLSLSTTVSVAGALHLLYPGLAQHIGDLLDIGSKADFPAATPDLFKLNHAGVFYQPVAKTYVVHLAKETRYLLTGNSLEKQLAEELFVRDMDGSYWLALSQRCVHLGTTVAFRDDCKSFKCPSHGAHYHCDGEYLDGPAPRSMDRFPLSFHNDHLLVNTSQIMQTPHPSNITRVLSVSLVTCSA